MRFGSRVLSYLFPICFVMTMAALPSPADAAQCDCSQPLATGSQPTAGDCLKILRVAVRLDTCDPCDESACAPSGTLPVKATDALICLTAAVGGSATLNCPLTTTTTTTTTNGPPAKDSCAGATFRTAVGSDLDSGWDGAGHNAEIVAGAEITFGVVRRCGGDGDVCLIDSDCPAGATCDLTCDCDNPTGPNNVCEAFGPTSPKRCLSSLDPCTEAADCPIPEETCESFFGPPLPLVANGTPTCVTSYFAEPVTGTADMATGIGELSSFLRSRVYLGISTDMPCPRCGAPNQDPEIGDDFACEGGPNDLKTCTVAAVSPDFGGVSEDCPPSINANFSGIGLAIRFSRVTTGTDSRQAVLPCGGALADVHPVTGTGICLDGSNPPTFCSSNADCRKCDNDISVSCTSDTDRSGGSCATAPEQPITCGVYCHCGFCEGDQDRPCFNDSECDGDVCESGVQSDSSFEQLQGNNCSDGICGKTNPERCCAEGDPNCSIPTALFGECSDASYISCQDDTVCINSNAGTCVLEPRPCFENVIERTGTPSPLGSYCTDDPDVEPCTSNADCGVGTCEPLSSEPTSVALFCVPRTLSASINAAAGIPGPGAARFKAVVTATCRCGDGNLEINCGEECDDGNNLDGDGCNMACRSE